MIQVNYSIQSRQSLGMVRRFATVGLASTLVDILLFSVFQGAFGVPTLAANTLSYSAGMINSFMLHRRWTFAHRARKAVGAQFSQFAAVSLSALLLNSLLVLWLSPFFGTLFASTVMGAVMAKLCATAVGLGWNFLINSGWTFRDAHDEASA